MNFIHKLNNKLDSMEDAIRTPFVLLIMLFLAILAIAVSPTLAIIATVVLMYGRAFSISN